MTTLAEIEAVIDKLSPADKQELLVFLAARLRAEDSRLPRPRQFSTDQLQARVAADEADMQRFRDGQPK